MPIARAGTGFLNLALTVPLRPFSPTIFAIDFALPLLQTTFSPASCPVAAKSKLKNSIKHTFGCWVLFPV
jgi:hypothetical protein